ncbi:MAG: DUF2023 family protein [Spirochaetales bacterium]|nr:DUF2023 family protein [Spirochaetales bacterium]
MKVFNHHIYEYKKGLRSLVLHTLPSHLREQAERKLIQNQIPYIIRRVTSKKINIYFGEKACVDIVESFGDKPLTQFSDEEDFILGTMLGYCRLQQCERYLKRINKPTIKRVV